MKKEISDDTNRNYIGPLNRKSYRKGRKVKIEKTRKDKFQTGSICHVLIHNKKSRSDRKLKSNLTDQIILNYIDNILTQI